MPPDWLISLAWIALAAGLASALVVAIDILVVGHRQHMPIMDAVWPLTALYFGPVGVWGYWRLGRPNARTAHPAPTREHRQDKPAPAWRGGVLSASHCGAGCVLGDILGGTVVFATGWVLLGERLYTEYLLEFVLAWLFGIAFQYWSIKPARPSLSRAGAIRDAIKADTLSIVAFEVGMFAWMALASLVLFAHPLPINGPVFWFMMQVGMILGFATTYPVNQWLVRVGIKHGM